MEFFEPLMGINNLSIVLRLFLAVFCGGLIGLEREHKHRTAGFRTHILVCIGASLTTMTSQYLWTFFNPDWIYASENVSDMITSVSTFTLDPARLGAQVVAGIGFIGAGTIIVTKRRQVKGLTTAAGLWTTAIVGLAIGVGYYVAVVFVTILILVAELIFSRLEFAIAAKARDLTVYVEYGEGQDVGTLLETLRQRDVRVLDVEIAKIKSNTCETMMSAIMTLQFTKRVRHEEVLAELANLSDVRSVQEL